MGYKVEKRPVKAPSFTPEPNGIPIADLVHGTNGQLIVGQTGAAAAWTSVTGDVSLSAAGVTSIAANIHQVASVALSAANLIAMGTTPVSILSAPGSGKVIVPSLIVFEMTRTSTAFTGGGAVSFQYHTTTTSVPHSGSIPATVVTTGGAGTAVIMLGPNVGSNGLVLPVNEGIDITNATAAFAAGTGTANVFFYYRVITLV